MKVKVDKTVLASVALHVVVVGWVMLSFSTKALEMMPEDSVAVDVISPNELARVMAGTKTGKKENPKPLAEKVAEAKPVDDAVGKVTEKPPVVTEAAPPPQPKVEEKPVEKKPDPPKVVEKKEEPKKEEPKPVEKKPEPLKPDPIAEAIKKEEKKPPPKPVQAAKPPEPQKRIVERHFDQNQIAALLDKRDPSRQAVTNDTLNSNAALGTSRGAAADNSATWGAMFQRQVERCWKKPYGALESQKPQVAFAIRLKRDGMLEGTPVPEGVPATPYLRVYQESALRAILECQPYKLPANLYEEWKYFAPVFQEKA
ncbi:cell envelope integrity protein TolA [Bradyrhizobium roseum]|uniref:cell envelope integrity protein TolA n=1 Tax=Bradyrhizobium roseum TaxID=3056648 RepID=UPI0026065140|nr:cell envelope integrity protein TolA [Bradyrhizobium roseus]WKA29643.1 cell envelope integrity protein TolA [Bradyrhizobium roseus]